MDFLLKGYFSRNHIIFANKIFLISQNMEYFYIKSDFTNLLDDANLIKCFIKFLIKLSEKL